MRNILHLQDWQVIEVHEVRQDLVIEAVYGPVPDACPKCGVVGEIYKHGRITNAYTEAMNGIIKQINRRGRGYTFPILRARILHGFQSQPPKGFNRCECCRQDFERGEVKARYTMPVQYLALEPEPQNPMRLCRDCHQSYISQWFKDHGDSTLKSE